MDVQLNVDNHYFYIKLFLVFGLVTVLLAIWLHSVEWFFTSAVFFGLCVLFTKSLDNALIDLKREKESKAVK